MQQTSCMKPGLSHSATTIAYGFATVWTDIPLSSRASAVVWAASAGSRMMVRTKSWPRREGSVTMASAAMADVDC